MPAAFTYTFHGRTPGGVSFVSDGALIVRADLVEPVAAPGALRELAPHQIAAILERPPQALTALADLVPSRIAAATFRTPDDVALGERYVTVLRATGRAIVCGTTGLTGPIILRDGEEVLGALMPVSLLPEFGRYLPPPMPGATRARITAFSAERAHGSLALERGAGEVAFDAGALRGLKLDQAVVGGLVDCRVARGRDGAPRATDVWTAGTERPAGPPTTAPTPAPQPASPPPIRWPSRVAFDALLHNGLLGWCDGGTWARMTSKVLSRGAGVPADVDERDVHAVLYDAYGDPGAGHTRGAAALRDALFMIDRDVPPDRTALDASVAALASRFGVRARLAADQPADIVAVFDALGAALAAAGRTEQVYLVGRRWPFVVVRERVAPHGPFMGVEVWRDASAAATGAGPFDGNALLEALSTRLMPAGCTEILEVGTMRFDATRAAPAHCVHVLQRRFSERNEPFYFAVTSGLSARPLAATGPGSLVRAELMALANRHDAELARALAMLANMLHHPPAVTGVPIALGHVLTVAGGTVMGWSAFLLARTLAPLDLPWGTVDVARVVPITDAERAHLRERPDSLGGSLFVTQLEAQGIDAVLSRWYHPPG